MTSPEERERRRKRMKRDSIKRDLLSPKYRQRIVTNKKKRMVEDERRRDLEQEV